MGRGNFAKLGPYFQSSAHQGPEMWSPIRYMVFDCPDPDFIKEYVCFSFFLVVLGSKLVCSKTSFEDRYETILKAVPIFDFIICAPRVKRKNRKRIPKSGNNEPIRVHLSFF